MECARFELALIGFELGLFWVKLALNWLCIGFELGLFFFTIATYGPKKAQIGFVLHKKVIISYVIFRSSFFTVHCSWLIVRF